MDFLTLWQVFVPFFASLMLVLLYLTVRGNKRWWGWLLSLVAWGFLLMVFAGILWRGWYVEGLLQKPPVPKAPGTPEKWWRIQ